MKKYIVYIVIILIGSLIFMPFLGSVNLFDWDEINFAECAREMIVSKDYLRAQIDFMPFWEKPPLFIWLQVLSMKLFGINEFAARFPNAISGIATLVSLYYIGKKIYDESIANWWILLYVATWLPHLYFRSGIIDPSFNLFIFLSFFQFYLLTSGDKKWMHSILAGLFVGIAVLIKGPVAILVAVLSLLVLIVVNKGRNAIKIKYFSAIVLFSILPFFIWIFAASLAHGRQFGTWFFNEFISYQIRLLRTEDSDHGGPLYYHFVVLLIGCFPAAPFLFLYLSKKRKEINRNDFTKILWILFWVVLILFSIVKTKIVHYSSLCYLPLTALAAIAISELSKRNTATPVVVRIVFLITGSLVALFLILIPLAGSNINFIAQFIEDPFAKGNMTANVCWSLSESIPGFFYFACIWLSFLIMRTRVGYGMFYLCLVQIIIVFYSIVHFVPKIEAYSQRAAIDFYKEQAGKDVYILTCGFKSYAPLFYAAKNPATNPNYFLTEQVDANGNKILPTANRKWLLTGNVDKPTIIVTKCTDAVEYKRKPELRLIREVNGFAFFERK